MGSLPQLSECGSVGRDASDLDLVGELCFVAVIAHQAPGVTRLLGDGLIPVVATIGADASGQAYNINADSVAGALAQGLGAEKLVFLTDVAGLLLDPADPWPSGYRLADTWPRLRGAI